MRMGNSSCPAHVHAAINTNPAVAPLGLCFPLDLSASSTSASRRAAPRVRCGRPAHNPALIRLIAATTRGFGQRERVVLICERIPLSDSGPRSFLTPFSSLFPKWLFRQRRVRCVYSKHCTLQIFISLLRVSAVDYCHGDG